MKLYACYTPSHRAMLERHFLPSLKVAGISDFPMDVGIATSKLTGATIASLPQECPTGEFDTAGFQKTCLRKVDFILEALAKETEPFIFSDVDVRFYGPVVDDLTKCLGVADMAFQWDGSIGKECSGFMVLRPNERTRYFWNGVREWMQSKGAMDQDAAHAMMYVDHFKDSNRRIDHPLWNILPERYWTFGRNDKHWEPGMPVNPPADLLMHHANWTVGVENKMALLDEVKNARERPPALPPLDQSPVEKMREFAPQAERTLPFSEITRMLDDQRRRLTGPRHHPLPLALVLGFWKGDKRRALELAHLIADLEPAKRTDETCFIFARQANCPMDAEIHEAQLYVGRTFRFIDMEVKVDESKRYPGVCFDAWAHACQQLSDAYHTGRLPYGNAFFFEADGCPIGSDWIDRLKRAHEETLLGGKRVTGPLMRFGGVDASHQPGGHINGTMVMHLSCWDDHPSLRRCPPEVAWDVFHGLVLRCESSPSQIIVNHHGGRGLSESLYWEFAKESCFVTSLKDGSAHHWCRLTMQTEREKADRDACETTSIPWWKCIVCGMKAGKRYTVEQNSPNPAGGDRVSEVVLCDGCLPTTEGQMQAVIGRAKRG